MDEKIVEILNEIYDNKGIIWMLFYHHLYKDAKVDRKIS
jgi:hypothetical protein